MGIFAQFYFYSGLQIVEGIEGRWTSDGDFFSSSEFFCQPVW